MKKTLIRTSTLAVAGAAMVMGGAGLASAHGGAEDGSGAFAAGYAAESPGVLSGNLVQVPVDVPVNVCGLTAQLGGLLNPAFGNTCVNK